MSKTKTTTKNVQQSKKPKKSKKPQKPPKSKIECIQVVMSEEQIEAVKDAAKKLAKSYIFPGFGLADLMQFSMGLAQKVLNDGKYNNKKPWPNFIYIHLRNRLFNHKRDKWVKLLKYQVAEVTPLNFEPPTSYDCYEEKLGQIDTEEMLDSCPVYLRSTLLRMLYKCKVSHTKKNELKKWLKNLDL